MYSTKPLTQVVPVVTVAELAAWLDVDAADPILTIMLNAATGSAIEYLQHELINRERVVIYQRWPTTGTNTGRTLSPGNETYEHVIALPYALDATISELKLYNIVSTEFFKQDLKPTKILIDNFTISSEDDFPAIVVNYTSGYGAIADVPEMIKLGVLLIAAFMYEHRGGCKADQIMKQSGAESYLAPFRFNSVVM
jgi:hypothetical protein